MAGLINLEIEHGASFSHTFYWKNRDGSAVDITGASVLMQIRADQDVAAAHKASIASYTRPVGGDLPWFLGVDISGTEGKIIVSLSPAETPTVEAGNWWYDLKVTMPSTEVFRLVQGRVLVDPAVTA